MKTTIDFPDFRDAFRRYGRQDSYTFEGLELLFNFLEEMENSTGQELEMDVIALCCEYDENHWEDIAANYSIDLTDCDDEGDKIEAVRQHLEDNTMLVGESLPGTFVYAAF
jgi:hypothetical protein